MATSRFPISYSPSLRALFGVLGLGGRVSGVTVGPEVVDVRMGWAFHAAVPRSALDEAVPDTGRVSGWGVHGWAGRWLVNGSADGLVRLRIDPPVRARAVGFPVRLRELRLSLVTPDDFIRAVGQPTNQL